MMSQSKQNIWTKMATKNAIRVLGLIQLPFASVGVLTDYYPYVIRDLGLIQLPFASGELG